MSESTITDPNSQRPIQRLFRNLGQLALFLPVLAGIVVYLVWNRGLPALTQSSTQAAPQVISAAMLEERFGVKIRLIGVTAAGGMIDFRYKVLDKEKAEFLVGEGAQISLIAEDSGVILAAASHGMKHNETINDGGIYFHFYPNKGNAIKPGTLVSVDFGTVRLEPTAAQ